LDRAAAAAVSSCGEAVRKPTKYNLRIPLNAHQPEDSSHEASGPRVWFK
jgi:hypothetical protein